MITFGTKATTLDALDGQMHTAKIAPLVYFTVAEWQSDQDACLKRVASKLGLGPWIVRSSCQREDGTEESHAGAFLTIPGVEQETLQQSIMEVISSYGEEFDDDEILIQPMLSGVIRSGVAFSHDPNTCSPYRVVN